MKYLILILLLSCQSRVATVTNTPIDTTPLIHFRAMDDDSGILFIEDSSTHTISIADTSGNEVAFMENGKWTITNCEVALETVLKNMNDLMKEKRDHAQPSEYNAAFASKPH